MLGPSGRELDDQPQPVSATSESASDALRGPNSSLSLCRLGRLGRLIVEIAGAGNHRAITSVSYQ